MVPAFNNVFKVSIRRPEMCGKFLMNARSAIICVCVRGSDEVVVQPVTSNSSSTEWQLSR